MQIGIRRDDLQFEIDPSSVSYIDARSLSYDARIGDETEIRKQFLPIIQEELFDMLGTGLLVSFQQHDHVVS